MINIDHLQNGRGHERVGGARRRTLSVVVICKDEADRIEACLQSVSGLADEIIVLDSGSSDATVDIARRYTDKVWITDWPGFGPQRNRALARAGGDWVLMLDADERVSPELAAQIDRALDDPRLSATLLQLRWRTWFLGRPLRFGRFTSPQSRLFKREGAYYRDLQVHEAVVLPQRRVAVLDGYLDHHSWRSLGHAFDKHHRYARLLAQQKFDAGKTAGLGYARVRYVWDFLQQYLLRLSFLDGHRGLMISHVLGLYGYWKYAELSTLVASRGAVTRPLVAGRRTAVVPLKSTS